MTQKRSIEINEVAPLNERECPVCKGTGESKVNGYYHGEVVSVKKSPCPVCNGKKTVSETVWQRWQVLK
jgi:DnaJ-class molecular chaperone